jgi:hypothetical protein
MRPTCVAHCRSGRTAPSLVIAPCTNSATLASAVRLIWANFLTGQRCGEDQTIEGRAGTRGDREASRHRPQFGLPRVGDELSPNLPAGYVMRGGMRPPLSRGCWSPAGGSAGVPCPIRVWTCNDDYTLMGVCFWKVLSGSATWQAPRAALNDACLAAARRGIIFLWGMKRCIVANKRPSKPMVIGLGEMLDG